MTVLVRDRPEGDASLHRFLSGVYLLSGQTKLKYAGPGHKPGKSSIPFGTTADADTDRQSEQGACQGEEIGTHFVGHFDDNPPGGTQWDTGNWNDELDRFFSFLKNVDANNAITANQTERRRRRHQRRAHPWLPGAARPVPRTESRFASLQARAGRVKDHLIARLWPAAARIGAVVRLRETSFDGGFDLIQADGVDPESPLIEGSGRAVFVRVSVPFMTLAPL